MPASATLIGVGTPPAQALRLGFTTSTKAGAGTAQTGATPITTNFTNATTAGGATAFILPADVTGGGPLLFNNASSTAALVYPPVGGSIQGGSTDASFSVAQNKPVLFFKSSATAWIANLSA